MQSLFEGINAICGHIQRISDLLWDFPTNLEWYASIPILGKFSLAIILLVGSGIIFTFRLRFIQIRKFKYGIRLLTRKQVSKTGISPTASFLLSMAMRVGPGNILGVTGAISIGGPGAILWMWISAFFGMATAFTESTLSQIFKEKKNNEYVGGMPFYGRVLTGNSMWVGIGLSILYILYALLCLPAQGFNTISAAGAIASQITGISIETNSAFYWTAFVILIISVVFISFGGIKKVTKITDVAVPIMAAVYFLTVLVLIAVNFTKIPWFFEAVFGQAFTPHAVFGGSFGTILNQGIRRGLMSNEAGQGTITMPASASDADHPCDQGCIQMIGVFMDTIVICTLTGFVVIMGSMWLSEDAGTWMGLGKLDKFLTSAGSLTGGGIWYTSVSILISICFALFAFTCLLGFISFSEICTNRITGNTIFINLVRVLCLMVTAFGIMTSIAGLDLEALWNLSDFANILMVFCNLPLLYTGFKYVNTARNHFENRFLKNKEPYNSDTAGIDLPVWDEKSRELSST